MIAFLYARVSTKDKGQETENQLVDMRKFTERQEWTLAHEYIDHETGAISDREQFQAMLLACSQRKADVVLFWSLDRFTREGALPTLKYLDRLSSWGVGFRSYTEPYLDSCGMFKEVVITMLATLAKQERIRMSQRVKAGMERLRAQGKKFGRPRIGFEKRKRRQALDPEVITLLRAQSLTWGAIAERVGAGESTVRKFMARQVAEKGSFLEPEKSVDSKGFGKAVGNDKKTPGSETF